VKHEHQTEKRIIIVNTEARYSEMMDRVASPDCLLMMIREEKDPRTTSIEPGMVLFRSVLSSSYGFFPNQTETGLKRRILEFLAQTPIVAKQIRQIEKFFKKYGQKIKAIDGDVIANSFAGGRSWNVIAEKTWNTRFCEVTSREWLTEPLTVAQEYHLAAAMNLWRDYLLSVDMHIVLQNIEGDPADE
jgi:hypothetical protein